MEIGVPPIVQLVCVARLEQIAETGDFAQGFLKVVGGDIGELLELLIRPAQLRSGYFKCLLGCFQLLVSERIGDRAGDLGANPFRLCQLTFIVRIRL